MLVSMSKVEIIGPKVYFYEVLGLLHRLGCLHIEDVTKKGQLFVQPMKLDEQTSVKKQILQSLLVDINSILSSLLFDKQVDHEEMESLVEKYWREPEESFNDSVRAAVSSLKERAAALTKKRSDLQQELINLGRYEAIISKIIPLAGGIVALEGFDSLALLIEKKFVDSLQVIREELANMTKEQFHLMAAEVDEETVAVLIIYRKIYAAQVRSFILSENVNEVRLPEELAELSYDKALGRISIRRAEIPQELNQIQTELKQLADAWYMDLTAKKQVISDRLNELQIIPELGQTDYTFVIEGWMPKNRLRETQEAIKSKFGKRVALEEIQVSEAELEEAPVQYVHSRLVKPFERITQMFGNPRYGSVDPAPFLALFFPLFFGIILGDMGYASVVIVGGWWLKRRFKENEILQGLSLILIMAGISSFIFGFLYGEFFGDLPERFEIVRHVKIGGIMFPWERSKSEFLLPTLAFAVALGAAHIILGLVLGIVNAVRARARKHFIEKTAMLGALFSLFMIIGGSTSFLPKVLVTGGSALMVVFIALLIYSVGVMGPIEILGMVANIVSYARIMAIGLVSVILASLANEFGGMTGNVFLGVLVAAMVHAINIVIHLFTPSLHVLRLNFVEFYSKFYESGGKVYAPFKRGGEL